MLLGGCTRMGLDGQDGVDAFDDQSSAVTLHTPEW